MPTARHRHRRLAFGQPRLLGAQLVGPCVDEEVSWVIEKHEALCCFPGESVGYTYPAAYLGYFGPDYRRPEYIRREHEAARRHRWYMTSRLVTINDVYSFGPDVALQFDEFEDVVGRNFGQPAEGLGFDGSPVAHMWRTMNLAEQLRVSPAGPRR